MSTNAMVKPEKWHKVYQNDAECRFFKSLSRKSKNGKVLEWRTTTGLMKDANLSQKQVEAIASKYIQRGIVHQHSKDPSKFRYWENAQKKKKSTSSISETDKKRRVDDALSHTSP